MNNSTTTVINRISARWFFLVFWLLTFVIYIATARAGWVIDGVGFLYNMKHQGFWDFINRTYSQDQSFYQVLTLHYYIFYKIWGFNPWMWGLLYITIHALNVYLLFLLSKNILSDSWVGNSRVIAINCALWAYATDRICTEYKTFLSHACTRVWICFACRVACRESV